MNKLEKLLLEEYERGGRDAVINLVEDAGLEIGNYDSFFESIVPSKTVKGKVDVVGKDGKIRGSQG